MTQNQTDDLLAFLRQNGSIDPLQAFKHLGIYRLAPRIQDARRRLKPGEVIINTEPMGSPARYVLRSV